MKIALLDTSYPINSRNNKIIQSINKAFPLAEIHQIAWNRNGNHLKHDNPYIHIYNKFSPAGRLWTKAKNLWGYRRFVHSTIKDINPEIIIASHWDTLIIVPKLNRKRQKLIYENLDIPTGDFRAVFCFLEKKALKHTDLIIHASRFFKDLYPQPVQQIVLENKPFFTIENNSLYSVHKPLQIAYIGNIRYKDILFNLIDALKGNEKLKLTLHGGGPAYEEVKNYSKDISNVEMTGPYDYNNIAKVYTDVEIFTYVIRVPEAIKKIMNSVGCDYRFSKTVNFAYLMNICPNCKATHGDYFLHDDPTQAIYRHLLYKDEKRKILHVGTVLFEGVEYED